MRARFAVGAIAALSMQLVVPGAAAEDGTVTFKVTGAAANTKNDDAFASEQQDFFVCSAMDFGPTLRLPDKVSDRDTVAFPPPNTQSKTVANKNQRFFDFYFELWDDDQGCLGCGDDDDFDISPQNGFPPPKFNGHLVPCSYAGIQTGGFPHVTYDVCTGKLQVNPVNGSFPIFVGSNGATLDGKNTSSGTAKNWAQLQIEVTRQPANWLPDDVGLDRVEIVQATYQVRNAVVNKDTSLVIEITSTYPGPLPSTPVVGQLTDGATTVVDSRSVTLNPGKNYIALFDGSTAPPFRPQKTLGVGDGKIHGWAQINITENISPNAPPQLQDCANQNNFVEATALPLVRSFDLKTVFQRFDYEEDLNFISTAQLDAMHTRDEALRLSAWPLASLDTSKNYVAAWRDHGSDCLGMVFCFEPLNTVLKFNLAAALAGIDRLVLSVRNGWFADNAFRHQFIGGASGWSLGAFAPRAVLAEDGWYGVPTHELGHTYALSQRPCSNGGVFGICFDEYNHPVSDGRVYEAKGYDVRAGALGAPAIYPNGRYMSSNAGAPLTCPGGPPWGRDLCVANLMDANSTSGYVNWLDELSFDYLLENQLPHADPPVVNVAGVVHLPNGDGGGTVNPVMEALFPQFSYQFMGIEDFPEAPPTAMGEEFSGVGQFRVRLVTAAGVHDYRFQPRFLSDPARTDLAAGFSLNVPWDPSTSEIQIVGPSDPREEGCAARLCPGDGVVLASRPVTPFGPSASDLRAGRDVAAPPTPAGGSPAVPTIGPGHSAVVSWNQFDPDSPELHATLIVVPPGTPGGGGGPATPLGVEIAGGSLNVPHGRMTGAPGTYSGRLLVSDGVNTTEIYQSPLFTICNLTNGGVESCNGIDDDCDGTVDNGTVPDPVNVQLNPQPFPPSPDVLAWTADPKAQTYDVVFGNLGTLRSSLGNFTTALQGCLANDTVATSVPIPTDPPPGQGYFYLTRGTNCIGTGTYDSATSSQQGSRDGEIALSTAACR